jgi:hypothetical protein
MSAGNKLIRAPTHYLSSGLSHLDLESPGSGSPHLISGFQASSPRRRYARFHSTWPGVELTPGVESTRHDEPDHQLILEQGALVVSAFGEGRGTGSHLAQTSMGELEPARRRGAASPTAI